MLFKSEREMQNWLRSVLDKEKELISLIVDQPDYNYITGEELVIAKNFKYCINFTYANEILFENENISLEDNEIMRADFVLSSPENRGYVLVELKNSAQATREAGTELAAYASAIRDRLPISSETDYIKIIISEEWPSLLKRYVHSELFINRRHILCLTPKSENGKIVLSVVNPRTLVKKSTDTPRKFEASGYQVCLYDADTYSDKFDPKRMDRCIPLVRNVLEKIKLIAEKNNGSGFAFLWRDNSPNAIAKYSITLINSINYMGSIRKSARLDRSIFEFTPINPSIDFLITDIRESLANFVDAVAEYPNDWTILREIMLSNSNGDLLDFQAWGEFGSALNDYYSNRLRYDAPGTPTQKTDIGLIIVDEIINGIYL